MKTWLILTQPKHYAYALYLGVFALVLLSLALTILLTFLGIHSPMLILLGCMITVAVTIFLAIQPGFLVQEASLLFIEDQQHQLYVIDIRQSSPYFTKKPKHLARDLEQYLAWIDKYALVPDVARQIAYIDDKIERRHRLILSCRDEKAQPFTLIVGRNYPDLETLLVCLERIPSYRSMVETPPNHRPMYLGISLCVLLISIGITVLAHPAVGYLPNTFYFPCLGISYILFIIAIYQIVKYRRHE